MLVSQTGECAGSLSAGCLEDEVAAAAQGVIANGAARLMPFDTRRRFGCAGSIWILLERVSNDLLDQIATFSAARIPFRLETTYTGGTRWLEETDSSTDGGLVQDVEPPVRLLIVGSGADGVALAEQAKLIGWETVLLSSIAEWRGEVDHWTAAIVVTHNYGRDCAALRHLLPAGLRYLGVVGPRRRRDEMLSDALDAGATIASRLFAPAGVDIGAETAREIALSVIAEIQIVYAAATGVSLKERRAPIHEVATAAPVR